MIFKGTCSFMWWFRRKIKATSVGAERLQKPLNRMKSPHMFSQGVMRGRKSAARAVSRAQNYRAAREKCTCLPRRKFWISRARHHPPVFSSINYFQRNLQLHKVIEAENEGNIRWSWKVAEASHTHEIDIFVLQKPLLSMLSWNIAFKSKQKKLAHFLKRSTFLLAHFLKQSIFWKHAYFLEQFLAISCVWEASSTFQLQRMFPSCSA